MKLLTVAEVAKLLGVERKWVYEHARQGIIPHVKLGRQIRFRPESIQEWLTSIERK